MPCSFRLFNFWKEGRGNFIINDEKGTGKQLHLSDVNITITQNWEMERSRDYGEAECAKWINEMSLIIYWNVTLAHLNSQLLDWVKFL